MTDTTPDADLLTIMAPLAAVLEGAEDLADFHRMIAERQPALIPRLQESLAGLRDELTRIFQPYIDVAEGKISNDEFMAIMAAREAASIQQREAVYGEADEDGCWYVLCEDCDSEIECDELPSLYPVCDGCQAREAEEREALHADA